VNTEVASRVETARGARRSARAVVVLAIGPVVVLGGLLWALIQPYRITLFDPAGQGFWWLLAEPPLYVIAVGVVFHMAVAPGLVADLERGGDG
jgi:hypothetical protein